MTRPLSPTLKVLLLDDESAALKAMRQLLEPHTDVVIVGEAKNVHNALALTRQHKPKVAFIDVRLRGETAFDYVGQLDEPPPRLVFITAYDEYAVRGFECNALDYLMKPVLPERLTVTLDRIRRHELLQRRAASADDSVFLRFGQSARLMPWREISHIETSGNYTRVVTEDGASTLVLRPLKEWKPLFPPGLFLQIHRAVIVRVEAIREVKFLESSRHELILANGSVVSVSRGHWPDLKKALQAWHPEFRPLTR